MFYVYILESETTHEYYTGSTDDIVQRLDEHTRGMSRFTRWHKGPWRLIHSETFETRSQAVKREKKLRIKEVENILKLW